MDDLKRFNFKPGRLWLNGQYSHLSTKSLQQITCPFDDLKTKLNYI